MKKRKSSFEELKTRAYTREDLDQLSYEEVHELLVQAFQEAVVKDTHIEFDEDAFERDWLIKLRKKQKEDSDLAGLADLIEERIKEREKNDVSM